MDHGKYFHNHMMSKLTSKLGLSHESSTPYYPQEKGQVEAINKVLKMMLQRMIGSINQPGISLFMDRVGVSNLF